MSERKNDLLIIEDDSTIQLSLRIFLEHEGYTIHQAFTGREAQDRLISLRPMDFPDLVLLDLMLPDMSGEELLTGILATKGMAALPVLVMSAAVDAHQISVKHGKQLLQKPFELNELLEIVEKSCRKLTEPTGRAA